MFEKNSIFFLLTPPLLLKLTGANLELLGSGVQRGELGVSLQDLFNIGPYNDHRVKLKNAVTKYIMSNSKKDGTNHSAVFGSCDLPGPITERV